MWGSEIGAALLVRRTTLGLTQGQLALFAGVPAIEIVKIESGALADISYGIVERVVNQVGLRFQLAQAPDCSGTLEIVARTVSTSYKLALSPQTLLTILTSGKVPAEFQPHILTLLDEIPLPLVLCALEDAGCRSSLPMRDLLCNMSMWARTLGASRKGWQETP